jgi:hypothetical protein
MTTKSLKLGYIARRQYLSFAEFSWRWAIAFGLGLIILSLSVAILAVRTSALVSSSFAAPADPFALYHPLMSGQVVLDEYGCTHPSEPTCKIYPDDGPFHRIKATILLGRIAELSFYSHTLQLGDLIHHWGDPDSMRRSQDGRVITLVWETESHHLIAAMLLRGTQPHVQHVTVRIRH